MPLGSEIIFIISAPRSGSTLLQRLLANSPAIATDVESWLMLHPLYALRNRGIQTEYTHATSRDALLHLMAHYELGDDIFYEAVRSYADTFYLTALKKTGKQFFLDKTPPYTRIIEELRKTYPQSKFVYLVRNPLALLYSALTTWLNGEWENLYWCRYDLIGALRDLIDSIEQHAEMAHIVRYENLVGQPAMELAHLEEFLGISLGEATSYGLPETVRSNKNKQYFGDPDRISVNEKPNPDYAEKWKALADNPQSLHFAGAYLQVIGREIVTRLGYDYGYLMKSLGLPAEEKELPQTIIPWGVAIKSKAERSPRETLVLRKARKLNEQGYFAGRLAYWCDSWFDELRIAFRSHD